MGALWSRAWIWDFSSTHNTSVSRYMASVSSSCGPAVLVDQAAKPIPALDPAGRRAASAGDGPGLRARELVAEGHQARSGIGSSAGSTSA